MSANKLSLYFTLHYALDHSDLVKCSLKTLHVMSWQATVGTGWCCRRSKRHSQEILFLFMILSPHFRRPRAHFFRVKTDKMGRRRYPCMLCWVTIRPHWAEPVLSCWEPPQRTSSQTTCSQLSVLDRPWPMGGRRGLGSRPTGGGAAPLTHNKTWVTDLASHPEASHPAWVASWGGFEAGKTPSETASAPNREPGLRKCEVTLATRGTRRGPPSSC